MRNVAVGLAALLAASFGGPAMAESLQDEIQDEEQPGSEIEIDVQGGKAKIQREDGGPLFGPGQAAAEEAEEAEEDAVPLEPLDDPDNPSELDAIDEELPGEGPEDLSGPDDEDPLPE